MDVSIQYDDSVQFQRSTDYLSKKRAVRSMELGDVNIRMHCQHTQKNNYRIGPMMTHRLTRVSEIGYSRSFCFFVKSMLLRNESTHISFRVFFFFWRISESCMIQWHCQLILSWCDSLTISFRFIFSWNTRTRNLRANFTLLDTYACHYKLVLFFCLDHRNIFMSSYW